MLNCYCGEARRLDRRDKRVAAQLWFRQICITMRFDVLEGPEDLDDLVFDEDVLEDPRADADADADADAGADADEHKAQAKAQEQSLNRSGIVACVMYIFS